MRNKIKCGVVGVGFLGQHHARLYSEIEECELIGILDENCSRANEIATLYKCKVFKSLDDIAANCDCISVVTPTDRHAQVAIPLLKKNKHLLIEKPLCYSIEEAEQVIEEAEQRELILQVGHIEHYNPVTKFLEQNVNSPSFISTQRLAPFTIRGTDVSVVLDLMIHDIGIILQIVKSDVDHIDAIGMKVFSKSEDMANARIYFQNGCIADVSASRISEKKIREIRIFQKNAYISLDFMNQKGHLVKTNDQKIQKIEILIDREEPLKTELLSFLSCVKHGSTPKVSAKLGKRALEVAIKISKKIDERNLQT